MTTTKEWFTLLREALFCAQSFFVETKEKKEYPRIVTDTMMFYNNMPLEADLLTLEMKRVCSTKKYVEMMMVGMMVKKDQGNVAGPFFKEDSDAGLSLNTVSIKFYDLLKYIKENAPAAFKAKSGDVMYFICDSISRSFLSFIVDEMGEMPKPIREKIYNSTVKCKSASPYSSSKTSNMISTLSKIMDMPAIKGFTDAKFGKGLSPMIQTIIQKTDPVKAAKIAHELAGTMQGGDPSTMMSSLGDFFTDITSNLPTNDGYMSYQQG